MTLQIKLCPIVFLKFLQRTCLTSSWASCDLGFICMGLFFGWNPDCFRFWKRKAYVEASVYSDEGFFETSPAHIVRQQEITIMSYREFHLSISR